MDRNPLEEEEVLRWLEQERHVRLTTQDQTFCLGMELKDPKKLIGYVGLNFREEQAWLQVFLNQSYQHKGLALETVDAVLGFCFEGIKLHRVSAQCSNTNAPALRLYDRVGMRREGEFVKDRFVKGEWVNTVWFGALEEEYLRD